MMSISSLGNQCYLEQKMGSAVSVDNIADVTSVLLTWGGASRDHDILIVNNIVILSHQTVC